MRSSDPFCPDTSGATEIPKGKTKTGSERCRIVVSASLCSHPEILHVLRVDRCITGIRKMTVVLDNDMVKDMATSLIEAVVCPPPIRHDVHARFDPLKDQSMQGSLGPI